MNPKFLYNPRYSYPDLHADTDPSGYRVYETPGGPAPSVTTILSTLPNPGLDAWRQKVGEEEAKRISVEATTIGSHMHNYLEAYVKGLEEEEPKDDLQEIGKKMAVPIKRYGLRGLDEVWAVEEALHCHNLYAGRTDLIGVYDGLPSIIDYKTSKRLKTPEYIHHYKLQTAAYSIAHAEMFGEDVIKQAVILIAIRPSKYQPSDMQKFVIGPDEFQKYRDEWMDVVSNFYA